MIRCWNCGLPDVAERCPRCGAPQEQARRGTPPPADPPGGFQPPPGFIVNGVVGNGQPSGPLRPPPPSSGPLWPSGHPSGPLPPMRNPGGPPRPTGNPSGPLPPAGGYPPRGPQSGSLGRQSHHPNAAPPGWDDAQMPPGSRRPGMPLPARSGPFAPLPANDERVPPEYQRGAPPLRSRSQPIPPPQAPRGWDDDGPPEPPYGPPSGRVRSGAIQRGGPPPGWKDGPLADTPGAGARPGPEKQRASRQIEPRPEQAWDDSDHWGWSEPEQLSLSSATNAILGGAIGGVLGGAGWVAAVAVTGLSMPYLAVLVGLLAGLGARMALVQTRPWIIGAFGAAGTALAFLITQYALFDYGLIRQGLASGLFALSPLRFPQIYIDYVIGVSDDVTQTLGLSGKHPLDMGLLLAAMTICWLVLLRRKK